MGELRFKSPGLAALLSLLVCGAGQIYAGRWLRGLGFLAVAVVLTLSGVWPLAIVILLASIVDAYNLAKKFNLSVDRV